VRRGLGGLVLVLLALGAAGCAQALRQPMPELKGRLAVTVVPEPLSLPFGVHQIPDTAVYISGHQGQAAEVGSYFGVLGVLVADSAARSTGKGKVKDVEPHLRVEVAAEARRLLADRLAGADSARFTTTGGDGALEIAPFVVLNFTGPDQVRPWVVMRTALKDARGDEKWKTRYIAAVRQVRPLAGESGWAAAGGAPLREAVAEALGTAMDVLLRDATGALRRSPRPGKVSTQWVWLNPPGMEVEAEVLEETEDVLIVTPKIGDGAGFAGVNILDRKTTLYVIVEPRP
jgi:hypothetical protein